MKKYMYEDEKDYCEAAPMPKHTPLATAYIRDQPYEGLVSLSEGLRRGSMFPNLYEPYGMKEHYKYGGMKDYE